MSATRAVDPNIFNLMNKQYYLFYQRINIKDWDSVVGIATRYGMDDPGIKSRW
jgi:hypothetical protein